MEALIGTYEVTYTLGPPATISFFQVIHGHQAASFTGEDAERLRGLFTMVRKRIVSFAPHYNLITGAGDDMSIYAIATGRRLVYLNSDEVQQLRRLLGVELAVDSGAA